MSKNTVHSLLAMAIFTVFSAALMWLIMSAIVSFANWRWESALATPPGRILFSVGLLFVIFKAIPELWRPVK